MLDEKVLRAVQIYRETSLPAAECARRAGAPYQHVNAEIKRIKAGMSTPPVPTAARAAARHPIVDVSGDPRMKQLEDRHRAEFDALRARHRDEAAELATLVAAEMAGEEIRRAEDEMEALQRKIDELKRLKGGTQKPAGRPNLELVKPAGDVPAEVREFAERRGISIEAARVFMESEKTG